MTSDRRHLEHPATRDLPKSFNGHMRFLKEQFRKEVTWNKTYDGPRKLDPQSSPSENHNIDDYPQDTEKSYEIVTEDIVAEDSAKASNGEKKGVFAQLPILWPIFTCGAGLFSDGYINSSIGAVSTCLAQIYGKQYSNSSAIQNVSSIAFAGIVLGQLSFGYLADHYSRKLAMLLGNLILIVFSILVAGAWGAGTTSTKAGGLFTAITAYRFFLGIGIGSEYPSGSTAAAEACALLPAKKRNRWFIWFTNLMLNWGGLFAAIVPLVLVCIFGEHSLQWVWRLTLGLGAIPPLSLFILRLKFKESKSFTTSRFNKVMPYKLVFKFYWFRTTIISIIWFLFNFSSYAFGIYSSLIIKNLLGKNKPGAKASLKESFSWNVLFTFFYIPGGYLGAVFADYIGPRLTIGLGLLAQAFVGIGMTCGFVTLEKHIAAFTVIFGIFTSLGDFSTGDNIGLIAAKSYATPVRGTLYSISAASGKIGAFVGTYVFPQIIKNAGGSNTTNGMRAPFWVATALCMFSGFLALLFLPELDPDAIVEEDRKFHEYLESSGYDMSTLGVRAEDSEDVEEFVEVLNTQSSGKI